VKKRTAAPKQSASWTPEHQQIAAEILSMIQDMKEDPTQYLGKPIESFTGEELKQEVRRVSLCHEIRSHMPILAN
jgi:Txe/YoeB family toxin of Txe-Axe toxin-antitoxin module